MENEYDFLETVIKPFKNGNVEQIEVKVKYHNLSLQEYGFVSGFGETLEKAITDLSDSIQKMVESELFLLQTQE